MSEMCTGMTSITALPAKPSRVLNAATSPATTKYTAIFSAADLPNNPRRLTYVFCKHNPDASVSPPLLAFPVRLLCCRHDMDLFIAMETRIILIGHKTREYFLHTNAWKWLVPEGDQSIPCVLGDRSVQSVPHLAADHCSLLASHRHL
jgi:hypothetical protein